MSFLPVVARELRVAARRLGTYWTRVAMAAGATAVGASILLFSLYVPPQKVGYYVFLGLAGLSMLFCLSYGRQATADCLSLEKREGTLGLLFLTDLKGHDVVLGKLAATSMGGFYGLLAMLPVMAIPLLMGGITSGEFWRIALVLVNTFLLSLSIGIFVSALSWDARKALGANFLVLLFLIAIPPAIAFVIAALKSKPPIPELLVSCPVYTFYLSLAGPYRAQPQLFWGSFALQHMLTWLMLAFASRIVPSRWQDRPAQRENATWTGRWRHLLFGDLASQKAFRQQTLDINAFYWLAARARRKPLQVWAFLAGIGIWWMLGWASTGRIWFDAVTYVITALLLNTTLKIWLMIEASHRLGVDHKAGALELLLSTPLSVGDIVRGQWLALRRQFGRPLLAVLGLELVLLALLRRRSQAPEIVPMWTAGMVMLVMDLVAAGWVSMWLALRAKNPQQATLGTITRILVLPWIFLGIVTGVTGLWCFALGRPWEPTWRFSLFFWFGFGALADLVFGWVARARLLSSFRNIALQGLGTEVAPRKYWRHNQPAARPKAGRVEKSRTAESRASASWPSKHKRICVSLGASCLVMIIAWALWSRSSPSFPPPPVITLSQGNAPLRVLPGNPGLFFVLPDHSLWRWGAGATAKPEMPDLQQVGSDFDWVKVVTAHAHFLGLRTNGTLWRWNNVTAPALFHSGQDWVDVVALRAGSYVVALRRDGTLWEWGSSLPGRGGSVLSIGESAPVQVGTNSDWTAIWGTQMSVMALRKDRSFWVWGFLYTYVASANIMPRQTRVAEPTRLCRETNWLQFVESIPPILVASSGEAWETTGQPPAPDGPAAVSCRLLSTNAAYLRFTTAISGERKAYQIRSDGSLWEKECPFGALDPLKAGSWRRVGKRSDWVTLHAAGGTTLGLTADGTLWLWGYDPSLVPRANLAGTLRIIRARLGALFTRSPVTLGRAQTPFFQKNPQPILRMSPPPGS